MRYTLIALLLLTSCMPAAPVFVDPVVVPAPPPVVVPAPAPAPTPAPPVDAIPHDVLAQLNPEMDLAAVEALLGRPADMTFDVPGGAVDASFRSVLDRHGVVRRLEVRFKDGKYVSHVLF